MTVFQWLIFYSFHVNEWREGGSLFDPVWGCNYVNTLENKMKIQRLGGKEGGIDLGMESKGKLLF